mgnify:CR=1 FL=1
MIKKEQITFKNVKAFIQGYYRHFVHIYLQDKLIRNHIVDQYKVRMNSADKKCIVDGECKICGCKTPALFWADKSCDKPCYPPMMSKKNWYNFIGNKDWTLINTKTGLQFEYNHKIKE